MKHKGIRKSVLLSYIATYFLVFAIPLVVFSFIIYNQTVNKLRNEYMATVDTAAVGVQSSLVKLYDLAVANASFVRQNNYYSETYIRDFAGSFVYISQNMQNLSVINKNFLELAFYSAQSNLVYAESIYNRKFYFDNIFISPLLSEETDLSQISTVQWLKMHKVKYKDQEKLISTIIHPLRRSLKDGKQKTQALLFTHIDETEINQLLSPITAIKGSHCIVMWNNQPLLSDDFEFMQEFQKHQSDNYTNSSIQINGETYLIRQTQQSQQISLLSFLPQKNIHQIAGDIMLIYILSLTLSVAVAAILIFLSIRHNYVPIANLLKKIASQISLPDDAQQLNEMARTSYALDNILENKKQIEVDNRQFKINHIIVRLSENSASYIQKASYARRCDELQINLSAAYYCSIILKACENRNSLISAFANESWLNNIRIFCATDLEDNTVTALICADSCDYTPITNAMEKLDNMYGVAGIGEFVDHIAKVSTSYKQAFHALLHINPMQKIYFYHDASHVEKSDLLAQFAKETELFSSAIVQRRLNQMKLALSRINELLEMLPEGSTAPVLLHHIQFVAIKALAAANLPFNTTIDIFSTLPGTDNMQETKNWVSNFTTHLCSILESKADEENVLAEQPPARQETVKDIQYILLHINTNYMKPDFSIKALADELGVSVSNLSHFFKSRQGQNISDYISDLRITEAKRLLRENNMRISEIVPALGYTHISSFTKTFKKATGMTPSEYKATHTN